MPTTAPICEDCGLCCDGTLFSQVAVEEAEVPGLEEAFHAVGPRRLPLQPTAAGLRLPLPCAALDGFRCHIYDHRPARCRDFRCELLLDLDAGRVGAAYARVVVDEVRTLRDAVAARLPRDTPWWEARRRLRARVQDLPEERRELLDQLDRLDLLLTTRFRQPA